MRPSEACGVANSPRPERPYGTGVQPLLAARAAQPSLICAVASSAFEEWAHDIAWLLA